MKKYDYIIAGMGCAGLSLAYHLQQHPELSQKKVLLIDQDEKKSNDRTWSYWEAGEGVFESIVRKKWPKLHFKSPDYEEITDVAPYQYKMIRGIDFYNFILPKVKNNPNFDLVTDRIISIKKVGKTAVLESEKGRYVGDYIFNSALRPKIDKSACNYVAQHFKGWEIETKEDVFDPDIATFMDFDVPQNGEARFFYVLPTSKRHALVEIAIFSNNILADEKYDQLVGDYIQEQLSITDYDITHKEFGIIPMTDYGFEKHQNDRIIQLGTPGGQVKPSTGYAFTRIQSHINKVFKNLKEKRHPNRGLGQKSRFKFYDRIFLNVVVNNKVTAPELFRSLFQGNPTTRLLKFLGEETHLGEELLIINSPPKIPFTKALLEECF